MKIATEAEEDTTKPWRVHRRETRRDNGEPGPAIVDGEPWGPRRVQIPEQYHYLRHGEGVAGGRRSRNDGNKSRVDRGNRQHRR